MAAQMPYALPNASFIGFSGTPVKLLSTNTQEIFSARFNRWRHQRRVRTSDARRCLIK
ncbi:hypothetical protein P5630_01215 [Bacillus subtilis]|nr:hypothetical protein P5668_21655 [Bacillus subtilis]WGD91333.1 hypothetical protein P5665_01205 [Bacillus subtilis]